MEPTLLELDDGVVDLATGQVRRGDSTAALSAREARLLAMLAERPGEAVSRDELHAGLGVASPRAVDHAVRRLRAKLEADPAHPVHLRTVHGAGYRLVPRRAAPQRAERLARRVLALGRREVDLDLGVVTGPHATEQLTSKELELLLYLAKRRGRPVPRDELLARVWGHRAPGRTHTLEATVHRLRRKIERDAEAPEHLVTVRGRGYALQRPELPTGLGASALLQIAWAEALLAGPEAEAAAALARFGAICAEERPAWRGHRAEHSATQELALFRRVDDALGFALAVRARCREAELTVAAGVVLEAPSPIEGADGARFWVGPTVARLRSMLRACSSGELLVGARAVDRLEAVPCPVRARAPLPSEGADAVEIVELLDAPGPRSSEADTTPVERFFGRTDERDQVASWLEDHRLAVLAGPGGLGKTRLALELARALDPTRARVVRLRRGATARELAGRTAAALGLTLHPSAAPESLVGTALARRGAVLLVLDDLEAPDPDACALVSDWLARAPQLRVLVTARAAPPLEGGRVLHLASLDAESSLALFADRCSAAGHPLEDGDRTTAAEVVAGLGGWPLALELGAARAAVVGVAGVRARLGERLTLLRDPGRTDRHAALRDTLADSLDALPVEARDALRSCALFEGPFPPELAEAVVGPGALDALQVLCARSLLHRRDTGLELHGLVRDLALEELTASGRRAATEAAYAGAVLGRAEASAEGLDRAGLRSAVDELGALEADLRALVARGPPEVSVRAALAVDAWAVVATTPGSAIELLERAAATADRAGAELSWAVHLRLCDRCRVRGLPRKAAAAAARAASDARLLSSDHVAAVQVRQGLALASSSPAEARSILLAALERASPGAVETRVRAHNNLAALANGAGDLEGALAHLEPAVRALEAVGSVRRVTTLRANLAIVLGELGRPEEGMAWVRQQLRLHEGLESTYERVTLLGHLGNLLVDAGRPEDGATCLREAIRLRRAAAYPAGFELETLAELALEQGRARQAAELLGEALRFHRQSGRPDRVPQAELLLAICAARTGDPDRAEALIASAEPRDDSLVGQALARFARAHLAHARGVEVELPPEPTRTRSARVRLAMRIWARWRGS